MHHVVQRIGFFRMTRGLAVLLLIIGATTAAAFWIGPFRPLPAALHLYVSQGQLVAPNTVRLEPMRAPGSSRVRFPLVLAASNNGARAATPDRLDLSVPATFRVTRGLHRIEPEITSGNPLARYSIDIGGIQLPPDSDLYSILTDTIWIEPDIRYYDCIVAMDSIPEFAVPVTSTAAATAQIPVFYSFTGTPERQTGMFIALVDSALLQRPPVASIPEFEIFSREPEAPMPVLGELHEAGNRKSACGNPDSPVELYSVVWETAGGGRFIVVYLNGAPRKQLYDLNRDSIVELELWDPDNDGKFESWRQARYAIPTMVLPERLAIEGVANDSLANDPAWLSRFDDTAAGPFRFLSDSARVRYMPRIDTTAAATPGATAPPVNVVTDSTGRTRAVIDTAWLRKFNNPALGPYRFLNNPPARRAIVKPPPVRATPQRPRGPVPLGRPVPYPRPDSGGR